jgi:acyl-CoA synthetase (NDP forming)
MEFKSFFYPQSVAIIGSMSPGKLGAILAGQILEGGYSGLLSAVNPKGESPFSIPAYSSPAEIPQVPDLAVIVSPAQTVCAVLEDCGKAGIRSAVIITSGFSETGNHKAEEEILKVARQNGIRFIGPNCAGISNAGHHFFPTLELRTSAGGVGLVSQSGALGGVVLGWAQQKNLGISKFISYGNGTDLSQVDFLRYLAEDDETKVVALYIESVRDGRAFLEALSECASRKPVLVIKAGRTLAGTRATASHTGSMAGSDAVYDAAIRVSGAVRVKSVEALLDLCEGFIYTPCVKGKKVIVITNSGGPGVLSADHAEEIGLNISEPGAKLQAELRTFLPGHCSLKNPIDLTVEGSEEGYRKTLEAALKEYDAALAINVGTSYLDSMGLARGVVNGRRSSQKPVMASFVPEQLMRNCAEIMKQNGVVNFSSGERAMSVLSEMAAYEAFRSRQKRKRDWKYTGQTLPLPAGGHMLEPQAMTWLENNGIPVPPFHLAANPEEAVAACEKLGYPTVMKVVSADILHKSDAGGVIVGIRDAAAARTAFGLIQEAAMGKDFCGAIIYPMVREGMEVLLGLSCDPQFGPVVAFGLGGIYTEIWRDIVLRLAPVEVEVAREMIHEIKAIKLLTGARGKPSGDLEALAQTLSTFSRLPFIYPEIGEIDLNPVFLFSKGLIVGDVRVIRK